MSGLVRPVGSWRFLTPLDTVQEGDLGREFRNSDFDFNMWSLVRLHSTWDTSSGRQFVVGTPMHLMPRWEFIRAEESGTYIEIRKADV